MLSPAGQQRGCKLQTGVEGVPQAGVWEQDPAAQAGRAQLRSGNFTAVLWHLRWADARSQLGGQFSSASRGAVVAVLFSSAPPQRLGCTSTSTTCVKPALACRQRQPPGTAKPAVAPHLQTAK